MLVTLSAISSEDNGRQRLWSRPQKLILRRSISGLECVEISTLEISPTLPRCLSKGFSRITSMSPKRRTQGRERLSCSRLESKFSC